MELKSGIDENERKGLNVLKRVEQGIVTNAMGKIINEGCSIKSVNSKLNNNKKMGISYSNYNDHTKIEGGFFISIPNEISVKLKSGKIVKPTLASYIKNTLPNEWYGTDDTDALIAGFFCVKGVALYHSLHPVNTSYMVSTVTQTYKPNSSYSASNKVANSYSNQYMLSSDGCLFFPEYGAGKVGEKGRKGSDRLLINGSRYMASNGASYKKILNYYYTGGEISSGDIKYVSYGSIFRYYV